LIDPAEKWRSVRGAGWPDWLKTKTRSCEAVRREAEEDWGRGAGEAHCRRDILAMLLGDVPLSPKLWPRELVGLILGRHPGGLARRRRRSLIRRCQNQPKQCIAAMPDASESGTAVTSHSPAARSPRHRRGKFLDAIAVAGEKCWPQGAVGILRLDQCSPQ
jgi:hypothetical protein